MGANDQRVDLVFEGGSVKGIALAVLMRMSGSIFFVPVIGCDPHDGGEQTIVAAGLLSNFPVWLFDVTDRRPLCPTFELLLTPPPRRGAAPASGRGALPTIPGFIEYVRTLAAAAVGDHDRPRVRRLRAHDGDPDAGRRHDRVRHLCGPRPGARRLRPQRRDRVPPHLELPGLASEAPRQRSPVPVAVTRPRTNACRDGQR